MGKTKVPFPKCVQRCHIQHFLLHPPSWNRTAEVRRENSWITHLPETRKRLSLRSTKPINRGAQTGKQILRGLFRYRIARCRRHRCGRLRQLGRAVKREICKNGHLRQLHAYRFRYHIHGEFASRHHKGMAIVLRPVHPLTIRCKSARSPLHFRRGTAPHQCR